MIDLIEDVPYRHYVVRIYLVSGAQCQRTIWSPGHPWLHDEVQKMLIRMFDPYDVKRVTVRELIS